MCSIKYNSVIHFFPLKCHPQLTVSVSIFCSVVFCQIVKLQLVPWLLSIANTKEHRRKFAYQRVLSTFVSFALSQFSRIKRVCVVALKHLNGNLRLPFVSTLTLYCVLGRLSCCVWASQASVLKLNAPPF